MRFDSSYVVRQFRIVAIRFYELGRLQHLLEPRMPNVAPEQRRYRLSGHKIRIGRAGPQRFRIVPPG